MLSLNRNSVDGDYELLKALGLIDDEEDNDDEDDNDDRDNYWDPSKMYTGWDYLAHFGEDAWNNRKKWIAKLSYIRMH
ncbi:uncharacterized protein OCT59_020182 [Rhizophagus irregularis]|uniref:uncharacterized protein n=1 Tax=Rhizophagus irregularis TaxID=588596 RepID=UPI0033264D46|nr:hypothetical protein OCT59_020182 [Rhizophagus irregularis]